VKVQAATHSKKELTTIR